MARPVHAFSSYRPDAAILEVLALLQKLALAIVSLVALGTLLAWVVPPFAGLLPDGWDRMKANTAILSLLAAASIWLSRPRQSSAAVLVSRLLGCSVSVIAGLTLTEYLTARSFYLDTILAADRLNQVPGRMHFEIALVFTLIGFVLANIRSLKDFRASLIDPATLLLCFLLLMQIAGFIMSHLHLVVVPESHALSTPGVICLGLLGLLVFNRRAEYNSFAVLLSRGIAGRVARIATPIAVAIPFALDSVQALLIAHVKADPQLLSGIGAALISITSLCLVVALCRKIHDLENQVRELSLRDELTGLYNRRGFYFLAEQALRSARRGGDSFSICYFDLDDLKHINDTQGHDVGSELLREMGELMERVFRETDILGRLGGDEFVAACKGDQPPIPRLAASLNDAMLVANQRSGRSYKLSYSSGLAKCEADSNETLEKLVQRADREMYEVKRTRKRGPPRTP